MRDVRNVNVCVIGGAGFLGSHLVNYLIDNKKSTVLVLDNLISGLRKNINSHAKFMEYDIRNNEVGLTAILKTHQIKYVFNYAAEPYIPECFERPLDFFEINATAVLRVLNACQAADVKALLQVSSAEIYGEAKGRITEDTPIIPHSTYGVSKVAADGLVQVRWKEAQVPAIALRQFNCIGERETHDYVVPEIISQLHVTPGVVRLGNNSYRDFLYAGDAVQMAVELLECGQFGQVYNMGSEVGIKIYDLAKMIGGLMGQGDIQIISDSNRERPWEIWRLESDNTKLHKTIRKRPTVSLEGALQYTIDYFRKNGNKWDW